jgi:RimJ/RimL family protein N-acetyltransferase
MAQLPERIVGEDIVLRRWLVSDAERQAQAITASEEHLRPWMGWMAAEPQPIERRREMLASWEEEWSRGGDTRYAVLVDGSVAGSCGLHRRLGPDALEIGYWIHACFVRRGLATKVARLLTETAFSVPGINHVEIHHDKANIPSSGVPRRLGYELVGDRPSEVVPGLADTGIDCVWRIERSQWDAHHTDPDEARAVAERLAEERP